MGELIFNGILLMTSIGMAIYSTRIRIWEGYYGARYWPMMLLALAILLFAIKTVKIYKALPREKRSFKLDVNVFKDKSTKRLLFSFFWVILYATAMPYGGFFISTVIFGIGLSRILGMNNLKKLFIANMGVTLAIYAIFVWALDVMVPRGVGYLYYFNYWLELLV